jgi:carboxyl-terminal processing protease
MKPLYISILTGLVLGSLAVWPVWSKEPIGQVIKQQEKKIEPLPIQELQAFAEIFGRIKKDYVVEVSDRDLIEHAIQGMVEKLDPHSSYLNKEEYTDLKVGTTGKFGGLGIEVGMENGLVKVITPIDDTPAQRAGLKPGDLIIKLDDKPVKGMSLNDAVKVMRGKPGTKIVLTIMREGESKANKITVERAIIKVQSIKSRILDEQFGYVRITNFQVETSAQLHEAIKKLSKEVGGNLKGLILDLRNNPGGVLNSAVSVSDAFLEDGLIVYTEGRLTNSKVRFTAGPGDVLEGAPLVVLINDGSASASEIVAGALQDRKRAVIIGVQSFGKGSVQTVIPVAPHGALKLTTARYYTPNGRSIQAEGIVPDIKVENVKVSVEEKHSMIRVKEADLARHLNKGKEEEKKDNKPSLNEDEKDLKKIKDKKSLAEEDYILNEGLNLLKGLAILGRHHVIKDKPAKENTKE